LTTPVGASIGLTEIEARLVYGKDLYVLQSFEATHNLEFYKVLYRHNGEIVGAHFIGELAQELIASVAIIMGQNLKVLALRGIEGTVINEICQEISTCILSRNRNSAWFKLFSW
jgi:pyruvate/2-oxoglutarate dehydrogenase complex dihydrolipoamide dehydrogenase (E3) component